MEEELQSTTPMRVAKTGYIVLSGALCALGTLMVLLPDFSILLAGKILGVMLLVFGVIKLIGYFSKDLYQLAFQHDLAFGILLIALGLFVLLHPGETVAFFYRILGVIVLADGLLKIQTSLDARRFGVELWWLILALALAACVLGAVLLFRPTSGAQVVTAILGVMLLAEGILNLGVALCTVRVRPARRGGEVQGMSDAEGGPGRQSREETEESPM